MPETPEDIAYKMNPDPFSDVDDEAEPGCRGIEDLNKDEIAVLRSINPDTLKVEMFGEWSFGGETPSIGVLLDGVRVCLNPGYRELGAFYYSDSPTARVRIVEYINELVDDYVDGNLYH